MAKYTSLQLYLLEIVSRCDYSKQVVVISGSELEMQPLKSYDPLLIFGSSLQFEGIQKKIASPCCSALCTGVAQDLNQRPPACESCALFFSFCLKMLCT